MLLVAESDRAGGNLRETAVTLESLRYAPATRSYEYVATATSRLLLDHLEVTLGADTEEATYLYPTALDIWSGRLLANKLSLLKRDGARAGESWLGFRASYLLRLQEALPLKAPPSLTFSLPEFYLYAPDLLPSGVLEGPLLTNVHPAPDLSQVEGIRRALGGTVTCLQGPPGTGKSQTIAALIDEHLRRADGPRRILVTAFSYDAMLVLLRKLEGHRDAAGTPTAPGRSRRCSRTHPGGRWAKARGIWRCPAARWCWTASS